MLLVQHFLASVQTGTITFHCGFWNATVAYTLPLFPPNEITGCWTRELCSAGQHAYADLRH